MLQSVYILHIWVQNWSNLQPILSYNCFECSPSTCHDVTSVTSIWADFRCQGFYTRHENHGMSVFLGAKFSSTDSVYQNSMGILRARMASFCRVRRPVLLGRLTKSTKGQPFWQFKTLHSHISLQTIPHRLSFQSLNVTSTPLHWSQAFNRFLLPRLRGPSHKCMAWNHCRIGQGDQSYQGGRFKCRSFDWLMAYLWGLHLPEQYIPQINFNSLNSISQEEIRKIKWRGSVLIRDVVDDAQAVEWINKLKEFVKVNEGLGIRGNHRLNGYKAFI